MYTVLTVEALVSAGARGAFSADVVRAGADTDSEVAGGELGTLELLHPIFRYLTVSRNALNKNVLVVIVYTQASCYVKKWKSRKIVKW